MNCRKYGSKFTLGLWSLVLAANALFVASGAAFPVVLLLLAFAALIAGGVTIARHTQKPALSRSRG